jgi:hypothetical protein
MRHPGTNLRFSTVVLREGNNSTPKFQCGQRDKQVNSSSCVNETVNNSRRQLWSAMVGSAWSGDTRGHGRIDNAPATKRESDGAN